MPNILFTSFTILVSGICFYFGSGINDIWPFAWFAPIPVLIFALNNEDYKKVALVAFLAMLIGASNWLVYIKEYVPFFVVMGWILKIAIIFAMQILATIWLVRRSSPRLNVFIYPSVLVLSEYLQSFISPSTFDSISDSQIDFLPILQIASITGYLGITFLLGLFASSIAVSYYYRDKLKHMIYPLAVSLLIIGVTLVFGYVRLNLANKNYTEKINVALMSLPETKEEMLNPDKAINVVTRYEEQINKLDSKVNLIVLPEMIITITDQNRVEMQAIFFNAAKNKNAILVVGVNYLNKGKKYNQAWVFNPKQDKLFASYTKQHLLANFEGDYVAGKTLTTTLHDDRLIGVAICKDMDFINPARGYGKLGVSLLTVPAADFKVDRYAHVHPAIIRAIENNYSLVRVAQRGVITITNNFGKVVAELDTVNKPESILISSIEFGGGKSFYSKYGNWFAIVCMLLLGYCLIIIFRQNRLKNE